MRPGKHTRSSGSRTLEQLEEKYFGAKDTVRRNAYETQISIDTVGEWLRQAREAKKLTQLQLARKLDMDKSYISRIENNLKTQRIDTFLRILKVLQGHLVIRIRHAKGIREVELI